MKAKIKFELSIKIELKNQSKKYKKQHINMFKNIKYVIY